ncbi:MAG: 6-phosphogluconolactonase, partial [Gammaproteobacteria bacterium]|nr:6-phosphogluconolactonase [Gammaproteobacteria bacterium]
GSTPRMAYQLLVGADTDWSYWHIYFGDERCLPMDDPERNSVMAQKAWLDHVAIPQNQIYSIAAEIGAEGGAAAYSSVVEKALSSNMAFDMVLLGMGEDGHTASLFPGHHHNESELVHAVHQAPKPPADRVSLSLACLAHSRQIVLLVTGASKHNALTLWSAGESLPVASLRSDGEILLLVDRVAIDG